MAKRITNWQRQAWFTEYELCQSHINSIGSQVWVSTTIFLSINVTLLGGILYGILTNEAFFEAIKTECLPRQILLVCLAITILGAGIIFILYCWQKWLKRMKFQAAANFERMNRIESILTMERHTIVRMFDKYSEGKLTKQEEKVFKKFLETYDLKDKYSKPSGFDGLIKIAWTIIALWILFIAGTWIIT
jgi:MFS superfamily sulfate permease-like transporter